MRRLDFGSRTPQRVANTRPSEFDSTVRSYSKLRHLTPTKIEDYCKYLDQIEQDDDKRVHDSDDSDMGLENLQSSDESDGDARSGHGALILQAGSLSLPQATIYKPGSTVTKQNDFEFEYQNLRGVLCLT